jgi:hypothetical protein
MRLALHAEWTKIRTVASPLWLLLGTIAATVALSVAVTSVMTCGAAGCSEARRVDLERWYAGQEIALLHLVGDTSPDSDPRQAPPHLRTQSEAGQPGLLPYLTQRGLLVGLPRLDPAAYGEPPGRFIRPAADGEQQHSTGVVHQQHPRTRPWDWPACVHRSTGHNRAA